MKSNNGRFGELMSSVLLLSCSLSCADPQPNAAPPAAPSNGVVIPLEFSRGHMLLPAQINGSEPLSFMLDTGFSMTMLHPELAERLQLKRSGHVTIVGIAGEEEADVFEGAVFDFSGLTYTPRRVAALPSENRKRSRKREGVLGSGFFRRFVVEIDSKAKIVRLHEPKDFAYSGRGEIIPLKFRKDTPVVEAAINLPGRPAARGLFEIDTGCDGGLCLGADFVERNQLLESAGETEGSFKQGVGGGARTKMGQVPQFQLGRLTIDKPSTDFFLQGSPVDNGLAGHVGLQILRRYKVIFDYSRQQMILERYP